MATRLAYRGICVSDIDASCDFYVHALGFSLLDKKTRHSGQELSRVTGLADARLLRASVKHPDGPVLELLQFEHPHAFGSKERRPMNQLGLVHLSFNLEDIDVTADQIVQYGGRKYPHTRGYYDKSDCTMIYGTDPDGVRLELMAWKGHKLGFSHSGICVKNIEEAMPFYQALGFNPADNFDLSDGYDWMDAVNEIKGIKLRAQMLRNDEDDIIELIQVYQPGHVGDTNRRSLNQFGYGHLAFEVDEIESTWQQLERVGGRCIVEEQGCYAGYRRCQGVDSTGVRIELIQPE